MPRYCTNHPDRETLRICGRCERPFCPDCLIDTPVGGRCRDCARPPRSARRPVAWWRWPAIIGIAFFGGLIANVVCGFIPFLGWILAYIAGQAIAVWALRASGGRNGSALMSVTLTALVVGAVLSGPAVVFVQAAREVGGMVPLGEVLRVGLLGQLSFPAILWILARIGFLAGGAYARLR